MHHRLFIFFLPFFLGTSVSAQDFQAVDTYALQAPDEISKDLNKLTDYLVRDYTTDKEKVRSFYTWIIHNIDYDKSAYKNNRKRINHSNAGILDRRQAVCFGYSTLFQEMCTIAGISSELVPGYVKDQQTGVTDLTTANHAWNAVLIDDQWHLLDLTWGNGNERRQADYFFLTAPEELIYSHLPADPMWQLLDCVVKPGIFKKDKRFIEAYIKSSDSYFNYQDSINAFLALSAVERKFKTAENMYFFNPITENQELLGHTYMDQVSRLIDRATALELTDSTEAIKAVHRAIIENCKEADRYIDLYDHQKENLAYSYFNYGVVLSKDIQKGQDPTPILTEMLFYFQTAKEILEVLPKNFLLENALEQLDAYIQWVEEY